MTAFWNDQQALTSLDDLKHHGYGERDEIREEREEEDGWRDEPYDWEEDDE